MIAHRPFAFLGRSQHAGIDARHHFSIAAYHDRDRMGWGALRVCNDDVIAPGCGFPMHLHRDMEIVTYVLRGAVTHRDSLSHAECLRAGAVQVMSAGRGIEHSECNQGDEPSAVLQMWLRPRDEDTEPRRESMLTSRDDRAGMVRVLASGFAADEGALALRADARVLRLILSAGARTAHALAPGRFVYLVLIEGRATVNGLGVSARDGVAISQEARLDLVAIEDAELILVETT